MSTSTVHLPINFTSQHEDTVIRYLMDQLRGYDDWRTALDAFDILRQATVELSGTTYTFQTLYNQTIDTQFSDRYLQELITLPEVKTQGSALWAHFARQIFQSVTNFDWYSKEPAKSRLFLSYMLYWWNSFARGYAFEVEIFQDLEQSNIKFQAHDLLDRNERFSPNDLTIIEQTGDIKTSTYFLHIASPARHDFYIVRFTKRFQIYTIVVMLRPLAWDVINGDTINGDLSSVLEQLPVPVRIRSGDREFVIILYDEWKRRILNIQEDK